MSEVNDIVANSKSYADQALEGAMTLADRAASTFWAPIGQPLTDLRIQQPEGVTISNKPPEFSSSYRSTPFSGIMPEFVGTEGVSGINVSIGEVPSAPDMPNNPEAPLFDVGVLEADIPDLDIPDIPDAPKPLAFDLPTVHTVNLPTKPSISIPDSAVVLNGESPGDPSDYSASLQSAYADMSPVFKAFIDQGAQEFLDTYAPEYQHNRALLESKINAIAAGGTGMTNAIEEQIYERGRTRAEQEANKLEHEVLQASSERGMYVPSGAVTAGLLQAKRGSSMANAQQASETAIERMKIELQHLQFGLQLSAGLHDIALNSMIQQSQIVAGINKDALQYASAFTGLMVEQYNQRLQLLSSEIEVFKAKVEQARLSYEQALLKVEVYKAELEGVKLGVDVDQASVDLYNSLINGEKVKMELYNSQIKGIETIAQVEYYKVQIYSEEVKAYTSKTQAKTAEFQAYSAAMQGNTAVSQMYAAEVDGYATAAKVEESVARIKLAAYEAEIKNNTARTQAFQAQVSAYDSETKNRLAEFTANSTNEQNRLRAWTAVNEQSLKKAQIETQSTIAMNNARAEELKMKAANTHQNTEAWSRSMENRMKATTDASNTYASLAGTAMSAQNTMVSLYEEI